MSTINITINGVNVLEGKEFETTRKTVLDVATTQNIDAKTVKTALEFLGGKSFAESVQKNGKPADVIVISENDTVKAEYVRSNLAQRMLDALTSERRSGKIYTEKSEKKSDVAQKVAAF